LPASLLISFAVASVIVTVPVAVVPVTFAVAHLGDPHGVPPDDGHAAGAQVEASNAVAVA
jgi:hypothetical protein